MYRAQKFVETELPPLEWGQDIGWLLVAEGWLSADTLATLQAERLRRDVRLADMLHIRAGVPRSAIAEAEARLARTTLVDPVDLPADPRLLLAVGPAWCVQNGILPWRRSGGVTLVLSARPDLFPACEGRLQTALGPVRMLVADEDLLQQAIRQLADPALAFRAETLVPDEESCRNWRAGGGAAWFGLIVLSLIIATMLSPGPGLGLWIGAAALLMALHTALKFAATLAALRRPRPSSGVVPARLPTVSIMVPLFREKEVARQLVTRLGQLDYPEELLDILLILEADDDATRQMLSHADLPANMRIIEVPDGSVRTKPRAMNYALPHARGSIIGIYDAEDAPAPDQIRTVVRTFAERGRQVACLQGGLDFYNSDANWIARCFAIEYATWFRLILPGLARLGLVVPLGGTTLFLRRDALEALGAWDAHNVTEDADLGLRLARHGYRTELIDTVTREEANCHARPWVRQRSRWLKGYAITYLAHMRQPRQLFRDLGLRGGLSVQLIFLGTVAQFALAPALWSLWLLALGFGHPVVGVIGPGAMTCLIALCVVAEAVNIALALVATRRAGKPSLGLWAPTMMLYFPLATLAVYRALFELLTRPFYWHKTVHGLSDAALSPVPPPPAHRASDVLHRRSRYDPAARDRPRLRHRPQSP
ncbi:glycosyltransferase [Pelagovum pacificum]|uniref:Glycosyltransferase n=1 Tax=Pelagovum pacificum TaxID=2588711 RepID=A0A5C5G8U2_9RHOB|nr:glycosyltransferase [Pelagovum pacificum]QQA42057.1 glycosyltransferase [Pelagovum pacificum]TNY31146.1 glycosyltransferase [Pelagovum pacificum]